MCQDLYFDDSRNSNKKLDVYRNDNHEVILNEKFAIIQTINGNMHLKNIDKLLSVIQNQILDLNDTKILSVCLESGTIDYVKKIDDIKKNYNNLKIEKALREDYNNERKKYENYAKKDSSIENYSTEFLANYYNEFETCYVKEENFATAEYYNDNIGRVIINTSVYVNNTGNNFLTKNDISKVISKLKSDQFLLLIKSFKEEYKSKLLL